MKVYRFLLKLAIVITWPLISFGALVRLHGAGLSCPDWPLCYGQLIPPPGFTIAMEVGHRFVAALLGIVIIGLVYLSYRCKDIPGSFKAHSWALLGLVIFQGVLGGLTVLLGLHPLTVILHLVFGNGLLAALVWVNWQAWRKSGGQPAGSLSAGQRKHMRQLVGAAAIIFTMIVVSGGLNSSTYSGYSCTAFPLCHPGNPASFYLEIHTPEKDSGNALGANAYGEPEMIHMLHRVLAIFGGLALIYIALKGARLAKDAQSRMLFWTLLGLILAEIGVGIINALYLVPIPISTLHTALVATMTLVLANLASQYFEKASA